MGRCTKKRWPSKLRKQTKTSLKRRKNALAKRSDENAANKKENTSRRNLLPSFAATDHAVQNFNNTSIDSQNIEEFRILEDVWGIDEELESHKLCIEHDPDPPPEFDFEKTITGNRIVQLGYVLKWAMKLQMEHSKICTLGQLYPYRETCRGLGLVSQIDFKCSLCDIQISKYTKDPNEENSDINIGCVWGTIASGSTYSHTEELLSSMNIKSMNKDKFYKIEHHLEKVWNSQAWAAMENAGKEERQIAIQNNQIDEDGVPFITVYLDGGWSKRSYGHNYNAASGVAVIIGKTTGKVIYMGVRNKYCSICARAAHRDEDVKEHICYRNWSSSSSSMEADIIVQGFCESETQHGIRYEKFIADGDSSVFAKIKLNVPYSDKICKIECTNHAVKNYSKALHNIKNDTRNINLEVRRQLKQIHIDNLAKVVQKAIFYNSVERNIEDLKKDLQNGPNHVFGYHIDCKEYYCNTLGDITKSELENIKRSGLYYHITAALNSLMRKSEQLICNETNNRAELFMNIVARFNAGKRLNLTNRGSFQMRCDLSVLRYNKNISWHSSPWKKAMDKSPGQDFKKYINKKEKENSTRSNKPYRRIKEKSKLSKVDEDYGPRALQPELSKSEFASEYKRILANMKVDEKKQFEIAESTVGQYDNQQYILEKKYRLTASNFGRVYKLRESTGCHNTVKSILYPKAINHPALKYGKEKEHVAISLFQNKTGMVVRPAGLFVDIATGYLAASPDGLIGDAALIEVKCFYKAAKMGWTLQQAVETRKTCLVIDDNKKISLNTNNVYYSQIQGQLNITNRELCYFVVYINDKQDLHIETIHRDKKYWEQMKPKLENFYSKCMLPEIINKKIPKGLICKNETSLLQELGLDLK